MDIGFVCQCLEIYLKNKYIVLIEAAAQMQSDEREMEEVDCNVSTSLSKSLSVFVGLREFVIRVLKTIPTITKLRRSTVSETRVSEEHMLLIEDQHCCR